MTQLKRKQATYAIGVLVATYAVMVTVTTVVGIGFMLGMRALTGNDLPAMVFIVLGFIAGGPCLGYKVWTGSGLDERIRWYLNLRRSAS